MHIFHAAVSQWLAHKYGVPTIVTFDQPLFYKASQIVETVPDDHQLKDTVLLLGSFHTFMNFLGAVGSLMAGSGLDTLLEDIYGENTVVHMLRGKAVQRAFRGHLLVDRCLNKDLMSRIFESNPELVPLAEHLEDLYSDSADSIEMEDVFVSEAFITLEKAVTEKRAQLSADSKTSKLWLCYQRMLSIARSLIRADRTGSWDLHKGAVSDTLPIFSAAGHHNYLKSAYLYLQKMNKLEFTHPMVHRKFLNGFHVVRQSDTYWAGLGSDLVIEQTLMRSLKTSGGLTKGSGMSEEQRAVWTMSAPVTSQYHFAMQEFCDIVYATSEQHKEASKARVSRDA